MMLSCILIDDEPLALDLMEGYVKSIPFLKLVAKCNNAIAAIEVIEKEAVDLIFTDIQMPNLSGIEFSKIILNKGIKVIFTTAFEEFALEGYKVNAIDYLVKPISYLEFFLAANKAKQQTGTKSAYTDTTSYADDYIFVKSEYKLIKIELRDLIYIEGLKDYLKFYTVNSEKPILTLKTMKSLEEELSGKNFMRVHQSFMVNLKKIKTIERNRIVFGDKYIPISEKYKESFQKFIDASS
ncbi:LytTR family DNA-binding domain-containing protein [Aquimarina sp. 2201CG5-10]|uniref:LytR/AlgR family response regulator transcription factor n=1 Tax=Aquimarina callyspongiae TaxID=3098150 RepID=UPI002AB4D0CD|nr:LytTR family DNA-binding domain-containing protein [Aquimarina sp. 2201CG5-10]MDY8136049.1 LytTR family DNA-binding domain-containing protein [Aquimarina sp. 2201CG5-10]